MAQKKITELQLIGSIGGSENFPLDDGIQTYRATPLQMYTYMRPLIKPDISEISNLQINATVASNALTIALKTAAGTDATSSDKIRIGFRSATITSGAYLLREISGALSLVISSGSTLGSASTVAHNYYIYLIDNAGTPELAISMMLFPENRLISTTAEGGAGAADSNALMYSTTARSNVAYRCIGMISATEATAGTWATAPSKIQMGKHGDFVDTFDVRARYSTTSTGGIGNVETDYNPGTKEVDTCNAFSSGTGFTAPITGYYGAVAQYITGTYSTASVLVCKLNANSVTKANSTNVIASGNSGAHKAHAMFSSVLVNAGEVIKSRIYSSAGSPVFDGSAASNWVEFYLQKPI